MCAPHPPPPPESVIASYGPDAEDERPPNEKSHAYHFSITYHGCDFRLLTPPAILALPKCIFKGWRL